MKREEILAIKVLSQTLAGLIQWGRAILPNNNIFVEGYGTISGVENPFQLFILRERGEGEFYDFIVARNGVLETSITTRVMANAQTLPALFRAAAGELPGRITLDGIQVQGSPTRNPETPPSDHQENHRHRSE